MDPERVLQKIYNAEVRLNPAEMAENMLIANVFSGSYVRRMTIGPGSQRPLLVEQGSSFEGLKVGAPDEFDYLLLYDYSDRSDYITAVESRNLHASPNLPAIPGFWMLTVDGGDQRWTDRYTDLKYPYKRFLAPYKFRRELQAELNSHVEYCKDPKNTRPNDIIVKNHSYPSIKDPALTEVITKLNDEDLSIDLSIAIKIRMKSGEYKTFFAKKHENDENTMYWRCTYHDEEKRRIEAMDEQIKESYKTAKYLLKNVVQNSFVLKTALFHLNQTVPYDVLKTKMGFLRKMLDFLEKAYRCNSLEGFFNREYNVVGKYDGVFRRNMANRLDDLRELSDRDPRRFLEKLQKSAMMREA